MVLISVVCSKRISNEEEGHPKNRVLFVLQKILADEKKCKNDRQITISWELDRGGRLFLCMKKYNPLLSYVQNVKKKFGNKMLFGIIDGKK